MQALYLDCGARTPQLMRDSLGAMPRMRHLVTHVECLLAIIALTVPGRVLRAQDVPRSLSTAVRAYAKVPGDSALPPFRYALTDLNGDGHSDAIVLMGGDWCGAGGCNLVVFRATVRGFILVSASTISNEPIRISPEKAYGWRTLIVATKGVGNALMRFNGTRYPSNPTMQPKASQNQITAAETLSLHAGHGA